MTEMDLHHKHFLSVKTVNMSGHIFADYKNVNRAMAVADKQAKTAWRATKAYVSNSFTHAQESVINHIKMTAMSHNQSTVSRCIRRLTSPSSATPIANVRLVQAGQTDDHKHYDVNCAVAEVSLLLSTWDFSASTDMTFLGDWRELIMMGAARSGFFWAWPLPWCGFIKSFATYRFMVDIGYSMLRTEGQKQSWDAVLFSFECLLLLVPTIQRKRVTSMWTTLYKNRSFFKALFLQIQLEHAHDFNFSYTSAPEITITLGVFRDLAETANIKYIGIFLLSCFVCVQQNIPFQQLTHFRRKVVRPLNVCFVN